MSGLNAEPMMRTLALPYRVATRVDGKVAVEWPGLEYASAKGRANLSLTPTRASVTQSTLPVGGRIEAGGDGNQLIATLRDVRAAGASLNGRVRINDRERIDGTLQAQAANVQATVNAVGAFLGRRQGSMLPMSVGGSLTADGRVSGTITAPTLTATLQAPSLAIGDAQGIAVNGDLAYRTAALTVNRVDVVWQEARATASGTIGLRGQRALDLTVRADALQVAGLLRAVEQSSIPASGTLSAQARIGGTADAPVATMQVQGADLAAYNETLGSLNAAARLSGRQLDITSLVLDKPQAGGNGRITATGSYQLTTRQFTADLQSQNVKLLTLTLPDGRPVRGTVEAIAHANGTVQNLAGTINVRADDLVVGEYAVGAVVADTTLADARATTNAAVEKFGLTSTSTIAVNRPYQAAISATVNDLDLAALPLKLQTPLQGRMRAELEASGPLADPQSGRARATVETFAGSWNEKPLGRHNCTTRMNGSRSIDCS